MPFNKDNRNKEINDIHQSIIATKADKQKEKYCLRDYSEDVFELTSDMLVEDSSFNSKEQKKLAGTAECVLRKYSKLLSFSN